MKHLSHIFLLIAAAIAFAACSDDSADDTREVSFCAQVAWQNGMASSNARTSRALTATDIFAATTGPIAIGFNDYPQQINIQPSEGDAFTLNKSSKACDTHTGFLHYSPSINIKASGIEGITFTATATIDGDILQGTATQANLRDNHLQFTLRHTKALLRFAFKVDARYDKVRNILITGIDLNGSPCTLADKVLTTDNQFIAYVYVDPSVVTTSYTNNIKCTYNIYDKDAKFDGSMNAEELSRHLTRQGIVAKNQFTLGSLKDASNNTVTAIQAGYYYDLKVTLNPDYLYVLSEHDNKHITIGI
ncbi:MAG: hypothetical protein Q4D23_03990 [Bacteroidales bacterium]|nr:hypothetical protein [Bacteroidales bacterium]